MSEETPNDSEIIEISHNDTEDLGKIAATERESVEDTQSDDDEFGDFDDFDDFEEAPKPGASPLTDPNYEQTQTSIPNEANPVVPCLNENDFQSSAQLYASITSILAPITERTGDQISPTDTDTTTQHNPSTSLDSASYFNPRSASLWQQLLMVTAHDRPLDWKRSSIRKLFLVSLGVPLDLDEIMPNRNTKRLVLPSTSKRTDKSKNSHSSSKNTDEIDTPLLDSLLSEWGQLASVSSIALDGMDEQELESHLALLNVAIKNAQEWLESLTAKKESASKDKGTFEGVIESLVEYASRLRTTKKFKK